MQKDVGRESDAHSGAKRRSNCETITRVWLCWLWAPKARVIKEASSHAAPIMSTQQYLYSHISNSSTVSRSVKPLPTFLYRNASTICPVVTMPNKAENATAAEYEGLKFH